MGRLTKPHGRKRTRSKCPHSICQLFPNYQQLNACNNNSKERNL